MRTGATRSLLPTAVALAVLWTGNPAHAQSFEPTPPPTPAPAAPAAPAATVLHTRESVAEGAGERVWAQLTRAADGGALAGERIVFVGRGGTSCSEYTNGRGWATCVLTIPAPDYGPTGRAAGGVGLEEVTGEWSAWFPGDDHYATASAQRRDPLPRR